MEESLVGNFKFFTDQEIAGLQGNLPAMLDMARGIANVPFVLTSTLRTCAGNQAAMGAEHSTHILGLAVDIGLGHLAEGFERDNARRLIRKGLEAAGFCRYGSYVAHIHVDIGQAPDYAQDVEWFSPNA